MRGSSDRSYLFPALLLILYTAVMFIQVWPADEVLRADDYNYGLMASFKNELPEAFTEGFWRGYPLLGRADYRAPTWTHLVLSALPIDVYMDWIYGINLALASAFFLGFLRLLGLSLPAALAGALTAFWLGSNLTLLRPGHLEKYGVLLFASACLYALEQTLRRGSIRWSLVAGGCLGMMFMQQADLALFFSLLLGAYFLFGLWTRGPASPQRVARLALPLLIPALLFVWETYQGAMDTQVRSAEVLAQGSDEEKWEFATQWSWPPAEALEFIAPGVFGWWTHHPKAPYHGVTGRSPEWKATGKGLANLRLESTYLGILPIALCLLGIAGAFFLDDENAPPGLKETLFWALAAAITLLLAAGKFGPLYGLFHKLPLANAVRNPNKFLQVFQLAAGVLAAIGTEWLWRDHLDRGGRKAAGTLLIAVSAAACIASLTVNPDDAQQLQRFTDTPWVGQAEGILHQRQIAWLHLSLFAMGGAAVCFASMRPRVRQTAVVLLVALVAFDGWRLGQTYIDTLHTRFFKENRVAGFLKEHLGPNRVAVLENTGLYNLYLTHLFPAHGIPFSDVTAAPRLHTDYRRYFDAVGTDRVRNWREFGVTHVLASRRVWKSIQQNPAANGVFREVYAYDVVPHPAGGLRIADRTPGKSGAHVVLELLLPSDRFQLLSRWEQAPPEEFFDAVARGERPFQTVRVHTEVESGAYQGSPGKISGALASQRGVLLNVEVETPHALLRLADRYDPDLRIRVDDGPARPLLPVDGLFAGAILPQGAHRVELFFDGPFTGRALQWGGIGLTLAAALTLLIPRNTSSPKD